MEKRGAPAGLLKIVSWLWAKAVSFVALGNVLCDSAGPAHAAYLKAWCEVAGVRVTRQLVLRHQHSGHCAEVAITVFAGSHHTCKFRHGISRLLVANSEFLVQLCARHGLSRGRVLAGQPLEEAAGQVARAFQTFHRAEYLFFRQRLGSSALFVGRQGGAVPQEGVYLAFC